MSLLEQLRDPEKRRKLIESTEEKEETTSSAPVQKVKQPTEVKKQSLPSEQKGEVKKPAGTEKTTSLKVDTTTDIAMGVARVGKALGAKSQGVPTAQEGASSEQINAEVRQAKEANKSAEQKVASSGAVTPVAAKINPIAGGVSMFDDMALNGGIKKGFGGVAEDTNRRAREDGVVFPETPGMQLENFTGKDFKDERKKQLRISTLMGAPTYLL